jgi:hypothetical protein
LIAHELFHRMQGQLYLPKMRGGNNLHLDMLDGRYYLRLEWRALGSALKANTDVNRRKAAFDALVFRGARYQIFPDAAEQEQALELNEGLAEYTGVRAGNSTPAKQGDAAVSDPPLGLDDGRTFGRSFCLCDRSCLRIVARPVCSQMASAIANR